MDRLIGEMVSQARSAGADTETIAARLRGWLAMEPPARWQLIEPDAELARIVLHEMREQLALPVASCTPEECARGEALQGAMPAVLPSKAEAVRRLLPPASELTVLEVQGVAMELQAHVRRYLPGHGRDLVAIASRWQDFLRIAHTMLAAAGFAPDGLLVRDAAKPGWKRGLGAAAAVVCDAATAAELPAGCHAIVFRLLSDATLEKLRAAEARLSAAAG